MNLLDLKLSYFGKKKNQQVCNLLYKKYNKILKPKNKPQTDNYEKKHKNLKNPQVHY